MGQRWYESERTDRWFRTIVLVCLIALVGPLIVGRVTSDPTAWDWVRFGVWIFAVVGFALMTAQSWRNTTRDRARRLPATSVPPEDVRTAVDATPGRIAAIKLLREHHPGLGLKDAADLVDAAVGRQRDS
jgi:hypothetical protein